MPGGWSDWTFWQYTDKAQISGISGGVDCSYFHGFNQDLAAWMKRARIVSV
jgi:lysozyme